MAAGRARQMGARDTRFDSRRKSALFAGLATGATALPTAVDDMLGRRDFATLASGPLGEILIGGGFGLVARVIGSGYDELRTGDRAQIVFVAQTGDEITAVGWQDSSTIIYRGTFREGLRRAAVSRGPGNASTAAIYNGILYIGSKAGLFRFEGGAVVPVTELRVQGVTGLSAAEGVLWIIGHYDVHRLDESGFQTFRQPG